VTKRRVGTAARQLAVLFSKGIKPHRLYIKIVLADPYRELPSGSTGSIKVDIYIVQDEKYIAQTVRRQFYFGDLRDQLRPHTMTRYSPSNTSRSQPYGQNSKNYIFKFETHILFHPNHREQRTLCTKAKTCSSKMGKHSRKESNTTQ
jgi:hypothetical protein